MTANGDVQHNERNLRAEEPVGRTESDATHMRFRSTHPKVQITCLSCGRIFPATSNLQILEHYSEIRHPTFYSNCLYCRGKVHRYSVSSNDRLESHVKIYHDCYRWKRKLDK